MALRSGVDTVAYASFGVYTETYSGTGDQNIPSLYASLGLLEDATGGGAGGDFWSFIHWFWEFF